MPKRGSSPKGFDPVELMIIVVAMTVAFCAYLMAARVSGPPGGVATGVPTFIGVAAGLSALIRR